MPNKNRVELEGYLTRDAELKYSKSGGEIVNFQLATNNHYEKNGEKVSTVDYHRISMFNKLAKKFAFLKKGMNVAIEGRIKYSHWQKDDGTWVDSANIITNRCHVIQQFKNEESEDY